MVGLEKGIEAYKLYKNFIGDDGLVQVNISARTRDLLVGKFNPEERGSEVSSKSSMRFASRRARGTHRSKRKRNTTDESSVVNIETDYPKDLFDKARQEVYMLMLNDTFVRFKQSDLYTAYRTAYLNDDELMNRTMKNLGTTANHTMSCLKNKCCC